MNLQQLVNQLQDIATTWGIKVVGVLVAAIVGWIVANRLSGRLRKTLEARNFDLTLTRFFANLVRYAILAGVASVILFKLVNALAPMRAPAEDEDLGLDLSEHGERAYND